MSSTVFPSFDSLYHQPSSGSAVGNSAHGGVVSNYDTPESIATSRALFAKGASQLTADVILDAYARLVSALTGEDEVAFRYSLLPALDSGIKSSESARRFGIATAVLDSADELGTGIDSKRPCSVKRFPETSNEYQDAQTDFAVDVLENGETSSISATPFVLRVELGSHITLSIWFHRNLMSDTFARNILASAAEYLVAQSYLQPSKDLRGPIQSALNYPCLSRPPSLKQDKDQGYYEHGPALLHAAFTRRAKEHPERPALDFLVSLPSESSAARHEIFTYAELDRLTDALAIHLRSRVVPDGNQPIIPALMSSCIELYVCWIATLKSGFAFSPVSPDAPANQVLYQFQDVSASVVLGRGPRENALSEELDGAYAWIDVTAFIQEWRTSGSLQDTASLSHTIDENDLAYVMYTSGSTGVPKGVRIPHLAATCSIASHSLYLTHRASQSPSRWFQFATPTFDPSVMEIFVTFSTGNTLCSAERETSLTDPESTITELCATVMMATPSMAAILDPKKVPTLNDLWTMGEALNRKVIDNFSSDSAAYIERKGILGSKEGLLNAYGPTEGAINCTLVANFSAKDRGSIIGKALLTCSMFVMDPSKRTPTLMPLGFPGELIIGGPQVGAGYLNRPVETEKAFVFSEQYGKLYRTGDRARIVEDQQGSFTIEILGRITTDQVKLSGRRVELGDIENVISKIEGVRDAVAVVHKPVGGGYGSEQVVGCVLPQPGVDQDELVKSCQAVAEQWLQPHMRPSKYFLLDEMPRSRNGKIDRRTLGKIVEDLWPMPAADSSDEAVENEILDEKIQPVILERVAEACNVSAEPIRLSAELLSYGFDSLRAMRFLQKARAAGLRGLTVGDVVTCRTFRDLVVKYIESAKPELQQPTKTLEAASGAWKETVATFRGKHEVTCAQSLGVPVDAIEKILPTTATQSGMLASFLRSMINTSLVKHYINHSVYEVAAGHDVEAVCEAWVHALLRGDAFRTVFMSVDDDLAPFAQCVLSATCPLAQINIKAYTCSVEEEFDQTVSKALEEAEAAITLDRPPFNIAIVRSASRAAVVLSLFHAIFDGGSLQLLVKDVEDQYHEREPAPRTHLEVAVERHFRSDLQEAKEYWLHQLEGCAPTVFPSLSLSQSSFLPTSPRVSTVLANNTMQDLLLASKAYHISSLAVLQAAWSLILCAYTAKNDVVFGSVVSDRYSQETADCMAPTFVTVPIRVSADSPGLTAGDIAKRITRQNADALQHLHTPLSSLVTAEGRLHYDTLIAFQSFPSVAEGSGLWKSIDYPPMGNDFATMIEVWPTETGQLLLKATYEYKHMDDVAANTMLKQLADAITFVLEHPSRPYLDGRFNGRQELLSASAEVAFAEKSNEPLLLHLPFERHAQEAPQDLAVDFYYGVDDAAERVQWTYAELNEKANNLARHLVKRLGNLKDRVVPICMEKCPELYVAILGIVKAGGAWCPIHPDFPPRRRHDLIDRTDATLVLVAHATKELDPASIPQGVETLDITGCQPAPEEPLPVLPTAEPENLAYLIFTSGTTGPPKGVPIGHRAAASAMRSLSKTIPYDTKSGLIRCLQFSQFTFDVFVQDLFYTWRIGGTVVSSPRDLMLGSFVQLANFSEATHAHLTPAFASAVSRESIKTLEVVTMIGEKLTQPVADDWGTNMRGYNTYGPAEAAVVSTVQEFGPNPEHIKSSNVGIPLETVGAYVVQGTRVVMRNAIGELALAGDQLSQGYWKDADKSAEKFIFSENLGLTVYLTGDLVRQLGDGTFDFVGRDDDLVKIAGQRVELSEIAYFLRSSHPAVQQVEVLYLDSQKRSGKLVVAFLSVPSFDNGAVKFNPVTTPEAAAVIEVTLDSARRLLPGHMIPDMFIVLAQVPRTPSAKVDRHVLKQIFHDFETSFVDDVAADEQEAEWRDSNPVLVEVISQITGVFKEAIKPNNSLAALGIDSIGAIRLAAKMNSSNYSLSVLDVLRCKTISDIASFAGVKQARKALQQEVKDFHHQWFETVAEYLQTQTFQVAPASFLQESLLGESMRSPDSYWSNHFFKLDAGVELERLREAWIQLAKGTESLRAGFVPMAAIPNPPASRNPNATFLQVIYEEAKVDWTVVAVRSEILAHEARDISAAIAQQHQSSLFRKSPWAVTVLEDGEARIMMLTIHHSLHDGPALDYILADLSAIYEGSSTKPRCRLLEALAIAKAETSPEDVDAFWEKELQYFAEEDSVEQEGAQPASENIKPKMRSHEVVLSASKQELQEATRYLCANSMNTLIRAACAFSLAEFLEVQNLVFAEVLSDRIIDSRLQEAVAPLISVVPVPFKATGSAKELIREQSRIAHDTWDHRHVRPATVRRIIKRPQDQPLYPAVFVFHPESHADDTPSSAPWKPLDDLVGLNVEHTIAFNVWQNAEQKLVLEFSAADNVMTPQHQEVFVKQVDALLSAMIKRPETLIADLTNIFPVDLKSVTPHRPDTKCPVDWDPTFWVTHWAETHPDWQAVEVATQIWPTVESVSWTYKALDNYGNRVAAFIKKHGVVNGTVSICLPRTVEAFGIIHGIFKSGNTYLPLEESLPNERKIFLCQDSGASILFTTADLFEIPADFSTCKVVDVDSADFRAELDSLSDETVPVEYQPHANSYILYTSGSTGKPKGVLVSRQNLASFMQAQSEFICEVVPTTPSLAGTGKYLNLASRAFDVHIGEMFLSWRHGLTAVTAKRTVLLDDLGAALKNLKVTHASFVPSLLDQAGLTPDDAPDLHFLGVGGEKMTEKTRKLWGGHDRVGLINAYGPTEVTVGCCSGRLLPDSDPRNIGSPLGDSIGHVLRPGSDTYVKRMMPGELCFTGSLVANGYLNRPDAKGFVEDFNGVRMYRTGDIVRLMPDNTIEFIGRKDDQVKIRGQRVELGEISEGVRTSSPHPIDVATLVLKHKELSRQQLVAFVARSAKAKKQQLAFLEDEFDSINAQLRPTCQKILPAHMVPDLIFPVTSIPLTQTSAKADVKLLDSLFSSIPISRLMAGAQKSNGVVAANNRPLTTEEYAVADVVRAVINNDNIEIRPDTSIFELGIDSLSAISLFMKLRDIGYECSVANVLTHPMIEQLAQLPRKQDEDANLIKAHQELARVEAEYRADPAAPVPSELVEVVRPCLPLQEIMVARSVDSGDDADSFYVNHIMLQIASAVDISKLCKAWEAAVAENEILRTCFWFSGDHFRQVVLRSEASKIQWNSVRAEEDTPAQVLLEREYSRIRADIVQNISTKPPIRFTFGISQGGQRSTLLVSIHHALYDAESLYMLFQEVHNRYRGSAPELRPSLNTVLEYIASHDKESAQKHWQNLLKDWEQTRLIAQPDSLESPEQAKAVILKPRALATKLSSLEAAASRLKLTTAAVMQAAFGTALAQMLGTNDIIFGSVLSGRAVPVKGIENVLAPCITTIPQRVNMHSSGPTLLDVCNAFQVLSYESLEYQHTSARDIQAWVGADRPLFDSLFSFTRSQGEPFNFTLWKEVESDMPMDSSLAIEVEANSSTDQLLVGIGCMAVFGDASKAEELLEKIEMLVDIVLRGDQLSLADLGISTEASNSASAAARKITWDESIWSEQEENMRRFVAEFAQVPLENVRKNTSFLHIGIDSITAIRFARKLRENGYKISSADVMRNSCIGALCDSLNTAISEDVKAPARNGAVVEPQQPVVEAPANLNLSEEDSIEAVYRCTPLQVGMIIQTLGLDGRLYVHHHALRLAADVDLARWKEALYTTVQQLDVLRTSFHRPESQWIAVVHGKALCPWNEVQTEDFKAALDDLQETTSFTEATQFEQPPVKTTLFRDASSSFLFVVSMHHALYDGMSVPLIFQQLTDNYHKRQAPVPTPFYKAARMMTTNQEAAVSHWTNKLDGYRSINIPLTEEEKTSGHLNLSAITVPTGEQSVGFSLQTIALLAFTKALSCLVERRDVAFGVVLAGRNLQLENADTIIGPTFNTVPYRVRLANPLSSNQHELEKLQQQMVDGIEFQHASFVEVQNRWRQGAGDATLTDSLFVFQKIDSGRNTDSQDVWKPYETEEVSIPSEYNMNFEVEQNEDGLVASAYSRLGKARLEAFLQSFKDAVQDIIANPGRYVTAFPPTLRSLPLEFEIEETENITWDDVAVQRYAAPIREAMAQVVNVPVESIDLSTNIFSIGLDSIAAIQVASRCRRNACIRIGVADIIQGVTLGRICKLVYDINNDEPDTTAQPIVLVQPEDEVAALAHLKIDKNDVEEVLPVLAGQDYHLAGWLASGRTLYEPSWSFKVTEPLDDELLQKSWHKLQERHSIMRTAFVTLKPDQAVQVVLKPSAIVDGSFTIQTATGDLKETVKTYIKEEARKPSTLFTPPVRLRLAHSGEGDALLITMHHTTYDAWTMSRLVSDLLSFYHSEPLEDVPSFSSFIHFTRSSLHKLDEQAFWQQALTNCQPTLLDRSSSFTPTDALSRHQTFVMSTGNAVNLASAEETCRRVGRQLHNIVLLAFARALSRATGNASPIFGFFQLGRSAAFDNIERVSGPTVNLLPLGINNVLERAPAAVADELQAALGARIPFEQSSLRDVARWVGTEGKVPFNASLNLLWHNDVLGGDLAEKKSLLEPLPVGVPTDFSSETALPGETAVDGLDAGFLQPENLYVDVGPAREAGTIRFGARCDRALLDRESVERFLGLFEEEIGRTVEGLE